MEIYVNELKQAIEQTYPYENDRESGFFFKLIEQKLNAVDTGSVNAWSRFIEVLQRDHPALQNMIYIQFPNYKLQLPVGAGNDIGDQIFKSRTAHVVVSLLCKFFTVFFEDEYVLKSYSRLDESPRFRVFALNTITEKENKMREFVDQVMLQMKAFFSDYRYVHHLQLMVNKIDEPWAVHGVHIQPPLPIYTYLFDNSLFFDNGIIWH